MEETLERILNELKEMRQDITELKEMRQDITELKEMRQDITELKEGQKRIEEGQQRLQQNLIDSLGAYTEKIVQYVDDKTEALNKRVYSLETDIQRISRQ